MATTHPLPDVPADVDGVRVSYMEKAGKKFCAVRVQSGKNDIPLKHEVLLDAADATWATAFALARSRRVVTDEIMATLARRHHGEESGAEDAARQCAGELLGDHGPGSLAPCAYLAVPSARSSRVRSSRARRSRRSAPQTESDAYTRYELLAPGTAKFRIIYEVTANTPGATYYFNPIRKGSVATDESVFDRATGKPLVFDVVGSAVANAGGVRNRDTTQTYIRVKLARPVPPTAAKRAC